MKNILIAAVLFVILVVVGLVYSFLTNEKELGLQKIKIGESLFEIEVADTAVSQAKGLSGRGRLAEDKGMLFVFSELAMRSFWMAGMRFPLDIIWISGDRVVGISENLMPASIIETKIYSPPEPVDKVLEINAGLSDKLGIKAGNLIEILD